MGDLTNKVLKIGFDAKRACVNQVGLGSYSRNIICSLQKKLPQNKYFLYSPKTPLQKYMNIVRENTQLVLPKFKNPLYGAYWRSSLVSKHINEEKIDIFHGLSHVIPKGLKVPSVVTFHDLIFLHHPEWFGRFNSWNYHQSFLRSAKNADHIVSISEATKKDLVKYFNIDPSKITVTYQGCNPSFRKLEGEERQINLEKINKYNLKERQFFLFVGTVEKRKNVIRLIKAYATLNKADRDIYPLVFVGKPTKEAYEAQKVVNELQLNKNVQFLSYLEFDELVALMNFAKAITYPALIEGFGLPVLEGMSCGTPVLTSDCSSLTEVGGSPSYLVDPFKIDSIADGLAMILSDSNLYDSKSLEMKNHISKFSEEKTIDRLLSVYDLFV